MGVHQGGFRGSPGGRGDFSVLPTKRRRLLGSTHDSRPGPVSSFRARLTWLLDKLCPPYMPRPSSGHSGRGVASSVQGWFQPRATGTAYIDRLRSLSYVVVAHALGRAMSTLLVQERHLWLHLSEMREI
ncbi:hypothetical protein M9458_052128 [Cirrhinus mrigala]|uniref:Uncharacterized protein n=1 Tax=Cirrhinus mrigala TaxID=683832 RepID=A0ABD0MQU0_CIRMR